MTTEELKRILELHKKWLDEEEGGEKANLSHAYLRGANLTRANLMNADLTGADLCGADLSEANLRGANLTEADLRGANLTRANLMNADLTGADLDYSVWPLWHGLFGVKVDASIARQLAYHFCRLDCDDPEYQAARAAVADFANKYYRLEEYGEIKELKK